jgi:hypothetical protein
MQRKTMLKWKLDFGIDQVFQLMRDPSAILSYHQEKSLESITLSKSSREKSVSH